MFSTDFGCFHFQISDQTEEKGQTVQEHQVTNLDLPNVHFFHIWILRGHVMLSLDLHTKSADQP